MIHLHLSFLLFLYKMMIAVDVGMQVVPTVSKAETAGPNMRLTLPAFSITALQLGLSSMDADM
jgi:hypothetical protein